MAMGRSPVATRGFTVANCGMPTGNGGVGALPPGGCGAGGAGWGRRRSSLSPGRDGAGAGGSGRSRSAPGAGGVTGGDGGDGGIAWGGYRRGSGGGPAGA